MTSDIPPLELYSIVSEKFFEIESYSDDVLLFALFYQVYLLGYAPGSGGLANNIF